MKLHNILDYGAVADGLTLSTLSIQAAIDNCGPGETVLIPAGVYRSGALFLHSDMTLHVAEGATLLGSDDTADYPICPTPSRAAGDRATPASSIPRTSATPFRRRIGTRPGTSPSMKSG